MMKKMLETDPTIEYSFSNYNAYEKKYSGQDLNGKRLLIYRPRSIGDQLITTALVAFLKDRFPKCVIDYYCDPYVVPLWDGIPIFISPTPICFDGAKRSDYTLFLEGLYENDKEPDQDDCYTTMFRYAGFPSVDSKWKRPYLRFRPDELKRPANAPEKYILVQWEASAIYRSYPPRELAGLCARLAKHTTVVIVGQYPYPYVHGPNIIDLRQKTPGFRSLVPWVANASAVLCPDSSIGHLAACFPSVPTVSLWGSYDPRVRVAHYPNHIPLFAEKVCRFAPCFHGLVSEPPRGGCATATNDDPQSWVCGQIAAITPDMIVNTLLTAVNKC
jgi:ADP-heptose:LPS heptosyltransferase